MKPRVTCMVNVDTKTMPNSAKHTCKWARLIIQKMYTVYTFVNPVLLCSGLVYIGCTLSTPNKRHVFSGAAPIGKMASLEIWKVILRNIPSQNSPKTCLLYESDCIFRHDCFKYYSIINIVKYHQFYRFP